MSPHCAHYTKNIVLKKHLNVKKIYIIILMDSMRQLEKPEIKLTFQRVLW